MKITKQWLKKHYACGSGYAWFTRHYPKASGADAKTVLARLQAEKLGSWSYWLVQKAKLSAIVEDWYPNGRLLSRSTFRKGIFHGTTSSWHVNGTLFHCGLYKDGKEDGIHEYWDPTGNLTRREICRRGKLIRILRKKGVER